MKKKKFENICDKCKHRMIYRVRVANRNFTFIKCSFTGGYVTPDKITVIDCNFFDKYVKRREK